MRQECYLDKLPEHNVVHYTDDGGVAPLPKNIPYALYNSLKRPLRLLAIAIPAGMEDYFDELSAAMKEGALEDAMNRKIPLKYGIEWLE